MTRKAFAKMLYSKYPHYFDDSGMDTLVSFVLVVGYICQNEFVEPRFSESDQEVLRFYAKQLNKDGHFTFDEEK